MFFDSTRQTPTLQLKSKLNHFEISDKFSYHTNSYVGTIRSTTAEFKKSIYFINNISHYMKDFKLEDDHMASFIPVLNFIPVLRPA